MANTSYRCQSPAGFNLYSVDDAPKAPLGTVVQGVDKDLGAGEFVYLQGVANTAEGSWVTFYEADWTTSLLAANDIGSTAVALSAAVANKYGWCQVRGKAVAKVAAGFVDNGMLYATATAGTADDAVVAGDRVKGARGASAVGTPAAGLAYVELNHPFMDDGTAA